MELFDYAFKNLPSKAEEFSIPPAFYMNPEEEEDEDESPPAPPNSTSSNGDAKVECICTHCGKGFKTNQGMYGHMRIHQDKGGLKASGQRRLESLKVDHFGTNRLSWGWGATRKFVWKQTLDEHGPEAVMAAFTLMEMSRSKSNIDSSQMNKKRKAMESDSLDLDEKKHASENCNTSSPSDQALVEHRSSHQKNGEVQKSPSPNRKRKRKRKRKVKSESGSHSHVCEVCNKSYPMGHQLGGHKRAHRKKGPESDQ